MSAILLVDHDRWVLDMYARSLQRMGHSVHKSRTAQDSIDILDQNQIDLVITEVQLPGHNGVEVIHEIRSYDDWQNIPIVILSSVPPQSFGMTSKHWGDYGVRMFLYKPEVKPNALHEHIKDIVKV